MGLTAPSSTTQAYQFMPESYGAKGDGVADDTTAIKNAINAAVTYAQGHNYYAEIVFDAKIYQVSGALTQGGATKGNSQLPLPVINPVVGQKVVLVLRGVLDASAVPHWNQTVAQASGTVLRSGLTTGTNDGTYGVASVIGGPTAPQGYGQGGADATFSNMLVVIDGLTIIVPSDPTVIGFDFDGVAQYNVITGSVLANQLPSAPATPSHSWAMGLRGSAVNNNDNSNIGWMSVEGFYYAYVLNEHTTFVRLLAVYCIHGIYAIGGGAHTCLNGLYASMELCQSALFIDTGTVCQLNIVSLDVEDGGGTPFAPSWHISDTSNRGRGHIGFNSNTGVQPVVVGGQYLEIINNRSGPQALGGSSPAVPASTVALQNPFWRNAAVTVSLGTVTAIAVAGVATGITAGTVIVPTGQTIAITYSVAPSWSWVLM